MTEHILDALAAVTPDIREVLETSGGEKGDPNPTGDRAIPADRRADDLLLEQFADVDGVGIYASEERSDPIDCGEGYAVTIDPVDGSSNLEVNNCVGTVMGVYDTDELPAGGRDLVSAAVVVYGPRTTMTSVVDGEVTTASVVEGERIDPSPVSIPDGPLVCGLSGAADEWPEGLRDLLTDPDVGFKLRYTGAMVGDLMHLLQYGGLLVYPALDSRPDGVLRLQYESNPVAAIVEAAGGAATDETQPLLDREPGSLHERTPAFFGTPELVEQAQSSF